MLRPGDLFKFCGTLNSMKVDLTPKMYIRLEEVVFEHIVQKNPSHYLTFLDKTGIRKIYVGSSLEVLCEKIEENDK